MKKIYILLVLSLFFCLPANAAEKNISNQEKHSIIGIIIPLPEESSLLQKSIDHKKDLIIDGVTYHTGTINNKNVVFVNAGLGKVNSAIIATRLIRDFHPDLILMSGSSGSISPNLKKFDVIIGKQVSNVDFGELTKHGPQFDFTSFLENPQSHTPLPIIFNLNDGLIKLITQLNNTHSVNVKFGNIASTDIIPNSPPQDKLLRAANFDIVEMEGAPLMQACWLFKTPCMVIRGVSNSVTEPMTITDIGFAGDKAAKVLIAVLTNYNS